VKVICQKRPRKTGSFTLAQDTAEAIQKIITVGILEKTLSNFSGSRLPSGARSKTTTASFQLILCFVIVYLIINKIAILSDVL